MMTSKIVYIAFLLMGGVYSAAAAITSNVDVAGLVAGLGIGGIVVALINAYINRGQRGATTENISVNTQTMLSELIDSSTSTLRQSIEDQQEVINKQKSRIESLEAMITELKRELDESAIIQRLRDAEQDNIYLRGRVRTLIGRIDSLRKENERLVEEITHLANTSLSFRDNERGRDDTGREDS